MKIRPLLFFILFTTTTLAQTLKVRQLRCENLVNPIGVQRVTPSLSWQLVSTERNVLQTNYRVWVADNETLLSKNQGNIWDSGKIASDASIQVKYGANSPSANRRGGWGERSSKPLISNKKYFWKIQVWDNHNHSATSQISSFQMGILTQNDWKNAQWIAYERLADSLASTMVEDNKKDKVVGKNVLPMFRKSLNISKKIKNATIYIAGLGHFELTINGSKIGDHFLDAGWTKYDKEAQYVSFDVTQNLKNGENTLGVMLGNGFYYMPPVKKRYRKHKAQFGFPKMICRMAVEYADGTTEDIVSDTSWQTAPSPITFSSIYGGEDYDATMELKEPNWKNALIVEGPSALVSQMQEPLKVFETFPVKTFKKGPNDSWGYDFGQNLSGIIELKIKGKRGDTVRVYPAELIHGNNTANQQATGSPYYFEYILKGQDIETWRPRFSYYGFRYAQVKGAVPQGEENPMNLPQVVALTSLHTRQASEKAGNFECSNTLFNQTATLIDWGIKSNMASVLTDCPHREKLGWLEQVHLMGASVRFQYDILNLLKKQMSDIRNSQLTNGLVPATAPEYVKFNYMDGIFRDSPEWGSTCIIAPYYMYQWYGEKQELATNYETMQRYINYLQSIAKNHIVRQGLSDWYDLGPNHPGVSQFTPLGVTATATYYYDLTILTKIATILNKPTDVEKYKKLAIEVKKAFNETYFDKEKKYYSTNSQTANAMALYMDLVEEENKKAVLENLIADIRSRNNSLTAGDVGYRYVLRVLEENGRSDVVFDMNNRSDVPGYGFQLAKGATALTESWQALSNVSNNHFMLGHIMEWFYSGLAGIKQETGSVAFKNIVIEPQIIGDVSFAKASYRTPYGIVESHWQKNKDGLELNVKIPANTSATLILPSTKNSVSENGKIVQTRIFGGKSVVKVGSGNYKFTVK